MEGIAKDTEYQKGFKAGLELGEERGLRIASQKLYDIAEHRMMERRKQQVAYEITAARQALQEVKGE